MTFFLLGGNFFGQFKFRVLRGQDFSQNLSAHFDVGRKLLWNVNFGNCSTATFSNRKGTRQLLSLLAGIHKYMLCLSSVRNLFYNIFQNVSLKNRHISNVKSLKT